MIEHVLDTERRTVTCRAIGRMSFMEACAALRFVVITARAHKVSRTLLVLGNTHAFVTPTDMQVISPIIEACSDVLRKGRWAIVVPNSTSQALTTIALQELKLTGPHVACFRNEEEAVTWLQKQPHPHLA
jgi:hypothetical protein